MALIACSKEKVQINNELTGDIATEKSEDTFYVLEWKIYDSYDDYVNRLSYYSIIEDELKYYSENYSKNIFVQGFINSFTLIDNKLFLTQRIAGYEEIPEHTAIEVYDINLEELDKFAYISFNYNGKLLRKDIKHGHKRFLLLYSNYNRVSLYDQNNRMAYSASSLKYNLSSDFSVQASSELQENNIKYSAENCINENELIPWIGTSPVNGVGECIMFTPEYKIIFSNIPIVISNGFIDYNRNYLYKLYNRVKKIRVYNVDHDEYLDFDIEDTPHYQEIYAGFKDKVNKIKVEILEVYQGERYNDLCINLLKLYYF
jgi:hypothetical protein